jgi:TetR/AcrR family transcriptional repressor of nem operon
MPWEKTYDEAEVLDAAMRAFWTNGYQATSMADLVAATGLNRGSLYAGFGNKRAIFLHALRHYDRTYRSGFLDQIVQRAAPRDAILAVFDAAARGDPCLPSGCLMVNTALERAPHDPEIAAVVAACMAHVEAFFADCLSRSEAPPPDIAEAARVLQGLMIAILVMRRANPDSPSIPALLGQARRLAGAPATTGPTSPAASA